MYIEKTTIMHISGTLHHKRLASSYILRKNTTNELKPDYANKRMPTVFIYLLIICVHISSRVNTQNMGFRYPS